MVRIAGPSLARLVARGDAAASVARQAVVTTLTHITRDLRAPVTVDDLAPIMAYWRSGVTNVVATVEDAYRDGSSVVHAGLVAALDDARVAAGDVVASPFATVTNPHVEAYLAQAINRLTGVGNEIWEHARAELIEGMRRGEGVRELQDRVRSTVAVSTRRAEAIARTEVNGAANAGAIDQMRVAQVPSTKEWLATPGPRTRPDHAHAEGEVVDLNAKFTVGGFPLDRPHDPTAPASETVNCRCTLIFEVGEDDLFALTAAGGHADKLREYWVHGEGAAKIRWGQPGDFNRCVTHLGKYVGNPQGLCNTYHQEALGVPPGQETADIVALDFHPNEKRDAHGKWTKGGAGKFAPTVGNVKPGTPAVPAHVWQKNADGTVVAESDDGTARLVWHADKKKYDREERSNPQAGWSAAGQSYGKQAAYDQIKAGGWKQPHKQHDLAAHVTSESSPPADDQVKKVAATPPAKKTVPSVKKTASPTKTAPAASAQHAPVPDYNEPYAPGDPEVAWHTLQDGTVVAINPEGSRRHLWSQADNGFVSERLNPATAKWECETHDKQYVLSRQQMEDLLKYGGVQQPPGTMPPASWLGDKSKKSTPKKKLTSTGFAPVPAGNKPGKPIDLAQVTETTHADGTVVAISKDGTERLVWSTDQNKYMLEKKKTKNAEWAFGSYTTAISKESAKYFVTSSKWEQPPNDSPVASWLTGDIAPDKLAPYPAGLQAGKKSLAKNAYAQHPDGTVIAETPDGKMRIYWDASHKSYFTQMRQGNMWVSPPGEASGMTKKNTAAKLLAGDWVQPGPGHAMPNTIYHKNAQRTKATASSPAQPAFKPKPVQTVISVQPGEVHDDNLRFPRPAHAPMLSLDEARVMQKEITTPPPDGAAWQVDQRLAIKAYTGSAYEMMNDCQRYGRDCTTQAESLIARAQSAMRPATRDFTVLRRAKFPNWDPSQHIGDTIQDKGFLSTSIRPGVWAGNIKYQIHIKKGTPGAFVRDISMHSHEDEWLVAHSVKFKIIRAVKDPNDGGWFVQLEAV